MLKKLRTAAVILLAFLIFWIWWWHFSSPGWPLPDNVTGSRGDFSLAAPLPCSRTEAGITELNGKIYIIGGINGWGQTLTSFVSFDPALETWTILPDLPEPINHPGVVSYGTKVFVVGGFDPLGIRLRGFMFAKWDARASVYVYDINDRQWSRAPELPEPRGAGGVCFGDQSIWYVGGIKENRELSDDLFKFDLESQTWTRMKPMPSPRDHLRLEFVSGRLYAISGRKDDLRFNLSNVEVYDTFENRWLTAASIPAARGGLASAVWGSYIYTFGGESVWTCLDIIERYDTRSDKWEIVDRLPEGRHGIGAAVVNGRIHLIGGGRHPRISASSIHRIYTPKTDGK